MCRRNQLRGCIVLGFGIGVCVGYLLDSWLLCCLGGIILICIGLSMMSRG